MKQFSWGAVTVGQAFIKGRGKFNPDAPGCPGLGNPFPNIAPTQGL